MAAVLQKLVHKSYQLKAIPQKQFPLPTLKVLLKSNLAHAKNAGLCGTLNSTNLPLKAPRSIY